MCDIQVPCGLAGAEFNSKKKKKKKNKMIHGDF